MITFDRGKNKFIYRIAGIIQNGGRVLLHRSEQEQIWALPGGRAEMFEPSDKTIVREMMEEIGVAVNVKRLVYMVENFFVYEGINCHEIGMYYLIEAEKKSKIYANAEFDGDEGGTRLIFKWFDIEKLQEIQLYPSFLRTGLKNLPETAAHIIHRDQ